MKRIIIIATLMFSCGILQAQDFATHLTAARTAYTGGKLEDARFAMQQMMQELDILTGKEVLALLPAKLDTMNARSKEDHVSGTSGYAGVVVHREYGASAGNNGGMGTAELEVITNSPLIGTLNTLLSLPMLAGNPDQKVIKIGGYKALVQKQDQGERANYEVQLPLSNSLITFKAPGLSQDKVIALANAIPVAEIAKRIQ